VLYQYCETWARLLARLRCVFKLELHRSYAWAVCRHSLSSLAHFDLYGPNANAHTDFAQCCCAKAQAASEPRVQTHLQSYINHATQQEAVYQIQLTKLQASIQMVCSQVVTLCTMSRTWHAGLSSLVCLVQVIVHTFPSSCCLSVHSVSNYATSLAMS